MEDTFKLLNMTPEKKAMMVEDSEKEYYERLMLPYKRTLLNREQKEKRRVELDKERQLAETEILA